MKKLLTLFTVALSCASIWAAGGALSGRFSINANGDQIVFSKGNLQATTTNYGANWTWKFAENQWDYIGNAASNTAIDGNGTVSTNGTVDLFCWSTNATYYGIHDIPSMDTYSGDFVDWSSNVSGGWRTLTNDEWHYMFYTRTNSDNLRGHATVNGIHGYILLPDGWVTPSGLSFQANPYNWTTNQYSGENWIAMQNAGAVFLPAAGRREGTSVLNVSASGGYWSSSPYYGYGAVGMYFYVDAVEVVGDPRYFGRAVRLVQLAPTTAIENTAVDTKIVKCIVNGQILILRGDKTYTMQGQEVK